MPRAVMSKINAKPLPFILTPGYFKSGVAKVVDIDPLGSMGLSKGSIKA
ncbi:hypothetical protein T07_12693 [Trichinella nelsoni]|uniref:Uncharacterized protein n=1 Tax=Trichinella nelsoni TaxID=6336 RepID=A0A0V0RF05_9BILA|nr:hypothetical protein T07_12693 [Trichinella nelsoni]